MPTNRDLMGVGIAAEAAGRLGYNLQAAVTAAGTTAADATILLKAQNNVAMTASGSDGIKLPADAELMRPYMVYNSSGSTGKVYPPTSGTLNGGTATSGAISLTTLKTVMFWRQTNTSWNYFITA